MPMRTFNPALRQNTFHQWSYAYTTDRTNMTLQGAVNKTFVLLLLVAATASIVWAIVFNLGLSEFIRPIMLVSGIGLLILALITIFAKQWAPVTAPMFAFFEGVAVGGSLAILDTNSAWVIIQTMGLTFGAILCLLIIYRSGALRATENLKLGVVSATGAIFFIYLVNMGLRLFGMNVPYIHERGPLFIGFSLFILAMAALNLVLDFDFIENGAAQGAPKYLEWYSAFGLNITLIWLYLTIFWFLIRFSEIYGGRE